MLWIMKYKASLIHQDIQVSYLEYVGRQAAVTIKQNLLVYKFNLHIIASNIYIELNSLFLCLLIPELR